jgi:hypothetical protein
MLYAPLYYRLQIGPINDAYTDKIFAKVMEGLSHYSAAKYGVILE